MHMASPKASELASQREPNETVEAAFVRLTRDQPEPTDFHRWFCHYHQIPPKVREFLEGTNPSDNSDDLLRKYMPDFVSRSDFYDACTQRPEPATTSPASRAEPPVPAPPAPSDDSSE